MFDPKKYPADWKEIRARILARAQHRCEKCGVPNYVFRISGGDEYSDKINVYGVWEGKTTKIILTIAHLDHDTKNNVDENLRALCQRCHLRYDAKLHAKNAVVTRRKTKFVNQGELFI